MSLGMIFGAGILTYLTPCVLPLIPIYLSALVGGDIRSMEGGSRGTLILRAMLFSVGFIAVFTLLGLTASTFGSAMAEHKLVLQIGGALLILVFGLKFLGVIRIPFFDRVVQGDDSRFKTRFAWLNALIMGFVFALGWSPCVGPVLGSILTYTASTASSPLAGAGYLTIYGLGFALPLIITAAFAEAGAKGLKKLYPHL
ncbi:sulfite exporter TauE/SafE family protein, partial [Myxococcota bacterium]|nr:sulfite exporter TauE/SafE family protein [Myxococcota bacterium]